MNTLDKNPWKVESIQEFSCLKCPECIFFTKEQNYFEDHAIENHPLSVVLFDETMSSFETEDNFKEELIDEINHVNVGDIKKEPTDQDPSSTVLESEEVAENLRPSCEIKNNMKEKVLDDVDHVNVGDIKKEPIDQDTSEDPFDICGTNIKQEDEHFMSSSPNKRVTSDDELSSNHEIKPKKPNIEQSEFRNVVFNSSQHVTEKRINCQKYSIDASTKEVKKQSDVHETPIPVIHENKPKKIRQRKQKISVRNEVASEKDQQISIISKRDTIEYSPSHVSASKTNPISILDNSIWKKERSFKCPKCNFKARNQHNLDMHIKGKKNHLPQKKPGKQRIRQSSLKCPDCTFEATSQYNLDVHIKGKGKTAQFT